MTKGDMDSLAKDLIDALLPDVKGMLLAGARLQQVEDALVAAGLPANLARGIIRLAGVEVAVRSGNVEGAKAFVGSLL